MTIKKLKIDYIVGEKLKIHIKADKKTVDHVRKIMKPELTDFFASGKVDRIFHQKYCYRKALLRALKHFPNSPMYNSCADNINRGVTKVD